LEEGNVCFLEFIALKKDFKDVKGRYQFSPRLHSPRKWRWKWLWNWTEPM